MTISNFDSINFLTGNDLWITVNGFSNPTKNLKLKVKNLTNLQQHDLVLHPRPGNEFKINITSAVRSLFDEPLHDSMPLNTLAKFDITFDVSFVGAFPNDTQIVNKNFIRGYILEKWQEPYFIFNTSPTIDLIVGKPKYYTFSGLIFDHKNQLTKNGSVLTIEQVEYNTPLIDVKDCNFKLIRFLNSIGGYQYYLFENFEIKNSTKPLKNVPKIINAFNETAFKSLGTELKKEIEFITENSAEDQIIITEIINSIDVLMLHEGSLTFTKLVPNTNTTIENTWDKTFKNKIKFDFYNEVNNVL